MDIVLSHVTAFFFWRNFTGNVRSLRAATLPRGTDARPQLNAAARRELTALGIPLPEQRELHILVAEAPARPKLPNTRAHTATATLPAGAILRLSAHVCIVSPAYCFVQLAKTRSIPRAALIGTELCGTYARLATDTLAQRAPLTSRAELAAFVNLIPGVAGCKHATRAARHVFDNAASPMEAKVALMFCLPHALGGYALPRPALNTPVVLGKAARAVYHVETCRPDLYWAAAKLDVEYDGEVHEGQPARTKDAARAAALDAEGITVCALTYAQVVDAAAFDTVAHSVAKHVAHRLRVRTEAFDERRLWLRRELDLA